MQDLCLRTRQYSIRIIHLYRALPKRPDAQIVGKQALRSGTSAGAHYHEACHAKSNADFISKIEGALQELRETHYWLDIITDVEYVKASRVDPLKAETRELIAMFTKMVTNVKKKQKP